MFKRFSVIDLFHGSKNLENGEWISVLEKIPDIETSIYKVRLENGNEIAAYFCIDACTNLVSYFKDIKSCQWWDKIEKTPLYNVTHWRQSKDE